MYYVTLKKIESTHNNVCTETMHGLTPALPVVGRQFFMYSDEVLTPGTDTRFINTTTIQGVKVDEENGEIVFRTQNSIYTLTDISRADPMSDKKQDNENNDHDDDCC